MNPTIIKEYQGPGNKGEQDIFFILRPQANNFFCESMFLSIIRSFPEYKRTLWLEYLANIPGEMIQQNYLMEKHYGYRLFFAKQGAIALSGTMKQRFKKHFNCEADESNIVGAFEAMKIHGFTERELFLQSNQQSLETTMLKVNGQSIIRIQDKNNEPLFIINADIPDLLKRNFKGTNSAVFTFRTTLNYQKFNRLILQILNQVEQCLKDDEHNTHTNKNSLSQFLSPEDLLQLHTKNFYRHKHLFHFSNGPFEQILDAREFLYKPSGESIDVEHTTFAKYLTDNGASLHELNAILQNPIVNIQEKDYNIEESIYVYTRNMTYKKSSDILRKIQYQKITH